MFVFTLGLGLKVRKLLPCIEAPAAHRQRSHVQIPFALDALKCHEFQDATVLPSEAGGPPCSVAHAAPGPQASPGPPPIGLGLCTGQVPCSLPCPSWCSPVRIFLGTFSGRPLAVQTPWLLSSHSYTRSSAKQDCVLLLFPQHIVGAQEMFIHLTIIYSVPSEARHCAVLEAQQAGRQTLSQLRMHVGW